VKNRNGKQTTTQHCTWQWSSVSAWFDRRRWWRSVSINSQTI